MAGTLAAAEPHRLLRTTSPDNTVILATQASASIVDANHNVWTIANGVVMENGKSAGYSAGVTELAWEKGVVWQENASNLWWSWNGNGWDGGAGIATSPVPNSGGTTPPPPPPPTNPAPVTIGSGSDALVLTISEDAYQGDAQFTVSVDGKQIGGTLAAKAIHSAGQEQTFTINGDWNAGSHTVAVNFLNDAWGGSASTDRNLHVDGIVYDGKDTGQSATLGINGPKTFTFTDTTPPPNSTITLQTTNSTDTITASNITIKATAGDHILFLGGSSDNVNLVGGNETITVQSGAKNNTITTGAGDDKINLASSGNTVTAGDGINEVTETIGGNTFVLPTANNGMMDLFGISLSNDDKLDLRPALAATNWNGSASTIGNFVRVAMEGDDALVLISKRAHGAGSIVADLHGAGATNVQGLLAHAITQ
jgi:hypothetical protein